MEPLASDVLDRTSDSTGYRRARLLNSKSLGGEEAGLSIHAIALNR